ncbi:MAG TPA: hypothetical protein VGM51_11300 [Armatimonadota bacterium]|jgi:hypothetical protein
MTRNDEEVREAFAWGVLWSIVLLVVVIVAAGYFLWYKPSNSRPERNHLRAAVYNRLDGTSGRLSSLRGV